MLQLVILTFDEGSVGKEGNGQSLYKIREGGRLKLREN